MKGSETSGAVLRLESVLCERGGRLLFGPLSLAIAPGEALIVSGPNGVGKSSLLRLAAGLLAPATGMVMRGGRIAFDSEALALDRDLPLVDALRFWARLDGASSDRMLAGLDAMALRPLAEVPVRLLSTGQRRRAGLARIVASGAPLWLLDEPGNGLDARALGLLSAAMAAHRAAGGAILAASHMPIGLDAPRELAL